MLKTINKNFDDDTVTPEAILLDDKWQNGYRSDIGVEKSMTRAINHANDWERQNTERESRLLRTALRKPIPLSERAVQINLARKLQGKQRLKKNLEGLFEVLGTRVTDFKSELYDILH